MSYNKYNPKSKYSFEFKKCKICQCRSRDTNNYGACKEFMVDGDFHCLTCLEKEKLFNCRRCRKNINPVHAFTSGKVLCVHDGGQWGNEVDVSTVCCIDCLDQITKKRGISNIGEWKECETSGCRFTLSPNEEAMGREKCYHCWKKEHDKERAERNKAQEEDSQKYRKAHEKAQNWWSTLSSSERERECERLVENMKIGKYWANNIQEGDASGSAYNDFYIWQIKNGKFVSDMPHKVPIQIAEEFMKRGFGKVDLALVLRDCQIIKRDGNDNPLSSDQASPQFLTNSEGKSDNAISNYPNSNPEPNQSSTGSIKTIKFENKEKDDKNNATDSVEKSTNRNLVINLRTVKQITLTADGNLIIEFNNSENNSNSQAIQTVTNEQINDNQELKKVKNYLQKSTQKSASQQDLKSILENSSSAVEKPKNGNNALLIGGIGAVALIIGVVIGLLMKRNKKNNNK